MNEIIAAAKSGRGKSNAYSRMKNEITALCMLRARVARLKPVLAAGLAFVWCEKTIRRDPDNVMAAQKFIIDGLVAAKVLPDDGWRFVHSLVHEFTISAHPGVHVTIEEKGNE